MTFPGNIYNSLDVRLTEMQHPDKKRINLVDPVQFVVHMPGVDIGASFPA